MAKPLLAIGVLIYWAVLLPAYEFYRFNADGFFYMARYHHILASPWLVFAPDYSGRYHPFQFVISSVIYAAAALNPFAHGALMLFVHVLNSLLLFRLMKRFELDEVAAAAGALFFLFSSSQWSSLFEVSQLWRFAVVTFLILSTTAYVDFLKRVPSPRARRAYLFSLFFYVASFGFGEDGVSLPFFFIALSLGISGFSRPAAFFPTLPFFTLGALYAVIQAVSGNFAHSSVVISWGPHILANPIYWIKEFFHMLFIPREELVSWTGIPLRFGRMLPLLGMGFVLSGFLFLKGSMVEKLRILFGRRSFWLGFIWMLAGILPYLLIPKPPFEEAWPPPRYLYIPSAGVALMGGTFFGGLWHAAGKPLRLAAGALFALLLILNLGTNRFMMQKLGGQPRFATQEETPAAFSFLRQLEEIYPSLPRFATLVVENPPFPVGRLHALVNAYYGDLEIAGVENLSARENEKGVYYVRWESGALRPFSPPGRPA